MAAKRIITVEADESWEGIKDCGSRRGKLTHLGTVREKFTEEEATHLGFEGCIGV